MSEADWGGYNATYSQDSHGYQGAAARAYGQPTHAGPAVHAQGYGYHHDGQPRQGYGAPHPYGYAPQPERTGGLPPDGGVSRIAGLINGAGALVSVLLIAGMAVWGYKLAVRDVTGVPVVRALEGPMRVQPDDPGGVDAAYQGLAVNDVAAGEAGALAQQVALAPAPVTLSDEDVPAHQVAALAAAPADMVADMENDAVAMAEAEDLGLIGADTDAAILALVETVTENVQPLSSAGATQEASAVVAGAVIPASVPGVAVSPRPAPRPVDLVTRAATSPVELAVASAAAATEPDFRDIAATEVPAGTRLVQLGAYDNADVAQAEWNKIMARFSEVFVGKDRVIEKAQSGGKTFYRLRAMNFADLSDARRFCSALMAGQAACIPVVTR